MKLATPYCAKLYSSDFSQSINIQMMATNISCCKKLLSNKQSKQSVVKNKSYCLNKSELYKISSNIKLPAKPQNDELPTPDKVELELDSTLSRHRNKPFFLVALSLKTDRYRARSVCIERRIYASLSR